MLLESQRHLILSYHAEGVCITFSRKWVSVVHTVQNKWKKTNFLIFQDISDCNENYEYHNISNKCPYSNNHPSPFWLFLVQSKCEKNFSIKWPLLIFTIYARLDYFTHFELQVILVLLVKRNTLILYSHFHWHKFMFLLFMSFTDA